MTDNVFQFPKDKIVREVPPNIEEIEKQREKGRQNYSEDIINDIVENLSLLLDSYGIEQDGKHFERDFIFAVDALRALIYRAMLVDHTLHSFIDKHVTIMKRDATGNVVIDEPEPEDIILDATNQEVETQD